MSMNVFRSGLAAAFLTAAALLAGCRKEPGPGTNPGADGPAPGLYNLPVIETTDIHGHIIEKENSAIHYRMAYIADKVRDIRGDDKDRLLLLDGGDIYQGSSFSNLLEGKPVYIAMDRMGYDAVALGNHEFDWDLDVLTEPDGTMPDYEWDGENCVNEVPVLCANLYLNDSRVPWTKDYVIVEKSAVNSSGESVRVKIGIIGFAINYASSIMTSKFTEKGFSIREDYSIANDIAASLESSGQCDATVLLIHGAADKAALELGHSAIDMVLGGHSHAYMSGKTGSGIAYLQGGRYAERYAGGNLEFKVDRDGNITFSEANKLKVYSVDATLDLHAEPGQNEEDLDQDILDVSDYAIEATAQQSSDIIGHITVGATTYAVSGSGGRTCTMSNWMCDIIRRIGDADVAFVNGGGVRTTFPLNGQSRRDITVADVYEMFPFSNTTYVYDITYEDLLLVLEYSLTSGGESLFTGMTGIDCYFRNYSLVSLSKDGTEIYRNKAWTGDWESRKVRLAVSEYLATNQRVDYYTGLENPLLGWNETSRLRSSQMVDNESAILVLKKEAAASGGHLYIDTGTHYIQTP